MEGLWRPEVVVEGDTVSVHHGAEQAQLAFGHFDGGQEVCPEHHLVTGGRGQASLQQQHGAQVPVNTLSQIINNQLKSTF